MKNDIDEVYNNLEDEENLRRWFSKYPCNTCLVGPVCEQKGSGVCDVVIEWKLYRPKLKGGGQYYG